MHKPAMNAERSVNQVSLIPIFVGSLSCVSRLFNIDCKYMKTGGNDKVYAAIFGKIPLGRRENTRLFYVKSVEEAIEAIYLCGVTNNKV